MRPVAPTIRHAVGMVAGTAIDQARELIVGHIDCWAEVVCRRLEAPVEESPVKSVEPVEPAESVAGTATPLLISVATGAFIGATAAWLLARYSSKA